MNSNRGSQLTDGELRLSSSRACGRLRLRAGAEKTPTWFPLASWPSYIACAVAVLLLFISSVRRRRRPFLPTHTTSTAHPLPRFERVVSFATSLRSTLTRSRRPISSESSVSHFLPRGRPSWPSSSPPLWPAYSGCSHSFLSLVLRLPLCRDAHKQTGCSSCPQDTSERSIAAVFLAPFVSGKKMMYCSDAK